MTYILACNPSQLALVTTTVIANPVSADRANYNNLPISSSQHHLCQVYVIFLLQEEGGLFLNPQSVYHTITTNFLC